MEKAEIRTLACGFTQNSPHNRVDEAVAAPAALAGMIMYRTPLVGFASAADPLFLELRRPGVVGTHFRLPGEWLPTARTVVSFFLPFTDAVVESNKTHPRLPSPEWRHARCEGQVFLNALACHIADALRGEGWDALVPSADRRFKSNTASAGADGEWGHVPAFSSNWSERHVAHVAGLGTFGLSAGLITPEGMAGRFISVLTSLPLDADVRPYGNFDEYCVYCGACVRRCPQDAISLAGGKQHQPCAAYLDWTEKEFHPRYGCGKCQVRVPCERGIPKPRPK